MRITSFLFTLIFFAAITFSQAQDARIPTHVEVKIEPLPLSLEQEEEALILERHTARVKKGQEELKRELSQLATGQQDVEAQLYYLQNQQQQTEGGQNAHSQELHTLYKERADLLSQVAEILMENELLENAQTDQTEDWEKMPIGNSKALIQLNEQIRKLDTKIAVNEMAIPQQIDELETLEEQIEETMDLADQLIILQESNQELIQKLNK